MASILRRRGRVQVRLDARERAALLDIVTRLESGLAEADLSLRPTYEDATMQAEYERWVRPDIDQGVEADLEVIRDSLDSGEDLLLLTEAQVHAWLRGFNRLRLAAGATLGISEDGWETDAPEATRQRPEYGMMIALGWLQEELIAALDS